MIATGSGVVLLCGWSDGRFVVGDGDGDDEQVARAVGVADGADPGVEDHPEAVVGVGEEVLSAGSTYLALGGDPGLRRLVAGTERRGAGGVADGVGGAVPMVGGEEQQIAAVVFDHGGGFDDAVLPALVGVDQRDRRADDGGPGGTRA